MCCMLLINWNDFLAKLEILDGFPHLSTAEKVLILYFHYLSGLKMAGFDEEVDDWHTETNWLHSTELGTELHWFHLCMCTCAHGVIMFTYIFTNEVAGSDSTGCRNIWLRVNFKVTSSSVIVVPHWTFLDCRQFFITYEKLKNIFWLNFTGTILSDQVSLLHRLSVYNIFRIHTVLHSYNVQQFLCMYSCMVIIMSSVYYTGYATSTTFLCPFLM